MRSELFLENSSIIIYCLATLVSIITVELLLRINWSKLLVRLIKGIKLTLIALFDEELTDEQKELALRKAAFAMLSVSFKTLFLILAMVAVFYLDSPLSTLVLDHIHDLPATLDSSWFTLLLVKSIIAMVYWLLRTKLTSRDTNDDQESEVESDLAYSVISKALHDLALDSALIARMSFQLETKRFKRRPNPPKISCKSQQAVWVCGLARAGTTILTDVLYETGDFTSLTYRQMPFPLAPNVWKKLSRWGISGTEQKVERAHGDGLLVNIDSPEALEEVFWRVHESDVYQQSDSLPAHQTTQESLTAFENYLNYILLSQQQSSDQSSHSDKRYLSKNNNHLLRIPSLLSHFPQAKILIPLREPLEHAESLRRQHIKWVERHQRDPFSLSYMNWLAHHEFGLGHKPFSFNGLSEDSETDHVIGSTDSNSLNYWLIRWLDAYAHVETILNQQQYRSQLLVVDYQALSSTPQKVLSNVFDFLGLSIEREKLQYLAGRFKQAPKRASRDSVEPNLLIRAEELYDKLR